MACNQFSRRSAPALRPTADSADRAPHTLIVHLLMLRRYQYSLHLNPPSRTTHTHPPLSHTPRSTPHNNLSLASFQLEPVHPTLRRPPRPSLLLRNEWSQTRMTRLSSNRKKALRGQHPLFLWSLLPLLRLRIPFHQLRLHNLRPLLSDHLGGPQRDRDRPALVLHTLRTHKPDKRDADRRLPSLVPVLDQTTATVHPCLQRKINTRDRQKRIGTALHQIYHKLHTDRHSLALPGVGPNGRHRMLPSIPHSVPQAHPVDRPT